MRVPQVSERIKEAPAQALRGVFAGIGQLLLYTDKLRNKAPFGQQVPHVRAPEPSQAATSRTAPAEPVPDRTAASEPADRDVVTEPAVTQTPGIPATPKTPKSSRAPATPKTPKSSRAPRTPKIPAAPETPKSPTAPGEIRDFDKTGNVRLITGDEARADDEPPTAEQPPPAVAAEAPPLTTEEPGPAQAAAEEHTAASAGEPAAGSAEAGPPLPNYDQLSIASLRARLRNLDVTQVRGLVEYEKGHAGRADVIDMLERRIAKLEAGD